FRRATLQVEAENRVPHFFRCEKFHRMPQGCTVLSRPHGKGTRRHAPFLPSSFIRLLAQRVSAISEHLLTRCPGAPSTSGRRTLFFPFQVRRFLFILIMAESMVTNSH